MMETVNRDSDSLISRDKKHLRRAPPMANVQKQFEEFHESIKLKRFEENATLREKRDIILKKLKDELPKVFKELDKDLPEYEVRDLGSYAMGTGIRPVNEDFDIDQGIFFDCSTSKFEPVEPKEYVYEALDGHTTRVEVRRPCVTVWYQRDGESIYHVDLAVFVDGGFFGNTYLAKGKANSANEYRIWEKSDPVGLIDTVMERFEGGERAQFRRIVRYLKRWKDENFSPSGNEAPISVGLTVAAYRWMKTSFYDNAATEPNDLNALLGLVDTMLAKFPSFLGPRRLEVELPVPPKTDLFKDMTDKQQEQLESKLESLKNALQKAYESVDPHEACKALEKVFGSDFPVPSKEETASKQKKPFASSSSAA